MDIVKGATKMTNRICVGVISGSFGVKGEVRLKSFCADPEAIADYSPLYSEDGATSFDIRITMPVKGGFSVRLNGIDTKEQADALRGVTLFADRERLPSLPDDEYYYTDLVGLDVLDTGGVLLGKVVGVQNHGATDLLEVNGPTLKTSVLVPFTHVVVPTVDMTARRIIANPPDGLFPESSEN